MKIDSWCTVISKNAFVNTSHGFELPLRKPIISMTIEFDFGIVMYTTLVQ